MCLFYGISNLLYYYKYILYHKLFVVKYPFKNLRPNTEKC